MRRTKIVCTLGPSSNTRETIEALMRAGMDVARLNFSHGSHDDHRKTYTLLRRVASDLGRNVAVLMDLQGPKIRTGKLEDGKPIQLVPNAPIIVTTEQVPGNATRISTVYERLAHDVKPGDRILLADGVMELRVDRVTPPEVYCTVLRGGMLGEKKGMNLPGVAVSAPCLTEKDIEDLEFGLDLGVDYVALSFVRSPEDVIDLKKRIARTGKQAAVIAKIERPEALSRFADIIETADAIMVARGDLGVEVELHRVPQIQKTLIRMCNEMGVPVITATQMLESMMTNARPTRAEAADVANAIYDGTDAVMLSGETANGQYPVETVETMAQIVACADDAIAAAPAHEMHARLRDRRAHEAGFKEAIGQAVVRITQVINVKRIVVLTKSGFSAIAVSRYRPRTPITAITLREDTMRRCALFWGVDAVACVPHDELTALIRDIDEIMVERSLASLGDSLLIVAGVPLGAGGRTNLVHLHRVGEEHSV
ncbi:MAG: pyruvate kinase [Candidatus Hydrogenedentes bacterium]|nr:pyruvate kinase [Candidatus Hydrogenedentota bacterium]